MAGEGGRRVQIFVGQSSLTRDPAADTSRSQRGSFYFRTFARVCLLPYIGGTIIHILRLIFHLPITELPFEVDWVVVIVGGYAGLGLIVFADRIPFKSRWDKIAYGLLVFHLDGSVVVHAYILSSGNNQVLAILPYGYSLFAVGYFLALGLYVINLNRRLYR